MNIDKRDMKLILEWFRETKDFKKAVEKWQKDRDLRNEKQQKLTARCNEWSGLPPKQQAMVIEKIKKEIEEAY